MPYTLRITNEADRLLHLLSVREQRIIEEGITSRLVAQPTTPTRAIKRLRPNAVAEFELRLGELRVLNNVEEDASVVRVVLIGRKVGNRLMVEGEEFHEHDNDPADGTAGGP